MFNFKTLFQKNTPTQNTPKHQDPNLTTKCQDQLVGFFILFAFCSLFYIIGFFSGKEAFVVENPVQAAASDLHITKLLQTIQCPKN